MHLTDETLAVVGSAMLPMLGLVAWLVRHHLQGKQDLINELKEERDELQNQLRLQELESAAKLAQEAARIEKGKVDLDAAITEVVQLKASLKPAQDQLHESRKQYRDAVQKAQTNYDAWKKEKELKDRALEREKEQVAKVKSLEDACTGLLAQITTAESAREELTASKATVEKERERAKKRAAANAQKLKELQTQLAGVMKQDGRVWKKLVPATVTPFRSQRERKTPIISVLNLKGGVGKTTITANLAGYLGETVGKRVLMVDVDHQRSLSQLLLSNSARQAAATAGRTIQHFLASPNRDGTALVETAEAVPNLDNCWIITNTDPRPGHGADQSLDDLEMRLMGEWLVSPDSPDVRFLMRPGLQSDIVEGKFDYVLIDCPPRLTTACINALAASDFVLIPIQLEAVSIRSVQHLLTRLRELRDAGVLTELRVLGLLANMVSARAVDKSLHEGKLLETACAAAQVVWGHSVRVFDTKLSRETRYAEATRELDDGRELKLAVGYPVVRRQFQDLMVEIEGRINESLGIARVSS